MRQMTGYITMEQLLGEASPPPAPTVWYDESSKKQDDDDVFIGGAHQ
jgi:hypothetical protein